MELVNSNDKIIYDDGEIELDISVDEDTIWLNQKQIAKLFDVKIPIISKHIKNIFSSNELCKISTISKMETVQSEGNRKIKRTIEFYNLDMIVSIGYRVNSIKATKFRQWATSVLKQYIINGYAINSHKITYQRFKELEDDVTTLKQTVNNISNSIEDNSIALKQGIFYNGQIYEAYTFISDLIKSAKNSIVLIDNYIDDTVLTLLSKNQDITFTIYTNNISKQLKLDIDKYNQQYNNLEIKLSKSYHDRFLIIDDTEFYHIGASLKDLGKKIFGFSKMDRGLIKL